MRRNSYRSTAWSKWAMTWSVVLVGVPAGLAFAGFFFKVLLNCFMAGWGLV